MHQNNEDTSNRSGSFKIVGRDSRIDLSRYSITIHGREIIDYEKLQREDPELYDDVLRAEQDSI